MWRKHAISKSLWQRIGEKNGVIIKGVNAHFVVDAYRDSVHAGGALFFVAAPAIEIACFLHINQADDQVESRFCLP